MKKGWKYIFSFLLGAGAAGVLMLNMQQACIDKWKGLAGRNRGLFLLMDQWVRVNQDGKRLGSYFVKNGMKRIAIYGMGTVGRRLAKELKGSGIEVAYGIDRNAAEIYSEIRLMGIDDALPDADAVVVALIEGFDDACCILSEKVACPIIAIEDILNEI